MKKLIVMSFATLILMSSYAGGSRQTKEVAQSSAVTCTMEDCPYANTSACCCK